MLIKEIFRVLLVVAFLFSGCKKAEVEEVSRLSPDCNIEYLKLSAGNNLSNENGLIVETVSSNGQKRVRIKFRGYDTFLDPCNLPEDIAIGQSIRFSGTL